MNKRKTYPKKRNKKKKETLLKLNDPRMRDKTKATLVIIQLVRNE